MDENDRIGEKEEEERPPLCLPGANRTLYVVSALWERRPSRAKSNGGTRESSGPSWGLITDQGRFGLVAPSGRGHWARAAKALNASSLLWQVLIASDENVDMKCDEDGDGVQVG